MGKGANLRDSYFSCCLYLSAHQGWGWLRSPPACRRPAGPHRQPLPEEAHVGDPVVDLGQHVLQVLGRYPEETETPPAASAPPLMTSDLWAVSTCGWAGKHHPSEPCSPDSEPGSEPEVTEGRPFLSQASRHRGRQPLHGSPEPLQPRSQSPVPPRAGSSQDSQPNAQGLGASSGKRAKTRLSQAPALATRPGPSLTEAPCLPRQPA